LGVVGVGGAISLVGVAPTPIVGTSASIIFPCSIKIQKTGGGEPSLNAAQPYAKAEGRVFLLVPAYSGCPGTKAVKWLLLLYNDLEAPGITESEHTYFDINRL